MITNISIARVFVKDIDASKAFYLDVLGFAEHTDVTVGDGSYRWCTVMHPSQPELQVHLALPGPPYSPEMVASIERALDEGGMFGTLPAVLRWMAHPARSGPLTASSIGAVFSGVGGRRPARGPCRPRRLPAA